MIEVFALSYEYLQYPHSIVALAKEIRRIANDYNARKITNDELRDIFLWYSDKCPGKLFQGDDYNTSVKQIIGKRRIELLDMVFDSQQTTRREK